MEAPSRQSGPILCSPLLSTEQGQTSKWTSHPQWTSSTAGDGLESIAGSSHLGTYPEIILEPCIDRDWDFLLPPCQQCPPQCAEERQPVSPRQLPSPSRWEETCLGEGVPSTHQSSTQVTSERRASRAKPHTKHETGGRDQPGPHVQMWWLNIRQNSRSGWSRPGVDGGLLNMMGITA